jgi:hypothetical protein
MKRIDRLSALVECSTGSTPKVETIKRYIDILAKMGYSELYLGLTDGYKIEGEPYFNYMRGGYTTQQLKEIDAYAKSRGIEVIASIQTLAHLHYLKKYGPYTELFDTDHILLVGDERVYALIEKMFQTISKGISSKKIHLGYDEAKGLGTGKYFDLHGENDPREVLLKHLKRVLQIAEKYGYTCEIWADTLMNERKSKITAKEIKASLPANAEVIYWNYYLGDYDKLCDEIDKLKLYTNKIGFAGSVLKASGFAPYNRISIQNILTQMRVCEEKGVQHYIVTLWTDNGAQCSEWAAFPALFTVAEYANGNICCEEDVDKKKFFEITGCYYDDLKNLDYLNDPFMRNLPTRNTNSYWILFADIMLCNYDLLLSAGIGNAYQKLAERYEESAKRNACFEIFDIMAKMAEILAIKSELGVQLRKLYKAGDLSGLKTLQREDLLLLINKMQAFIPIFNSYWLNQRMGFGLERNHLFLGGQIARYQYIYDRIEEYLKTGKKIDELEADTLPPIFLKNINEDNCIEVDLKNILTYCGF